MKTAKTSSVPISAADFLPPRETLPRLQAAARECRGCELYERATQTVFGEGPAKASLMLVGEVPGDQEDRLGHPFVGPAGRLLDDALATAKIARQEVYLTNAVKHFDWEPRGKRRLHARPKTRHVNACRPWLEAEIRVVKPRVIICLGALAAQALLGRDFRITRDRGELIASSWAWRIMATWHPSAVLRAPEVRDRERMQQELTDDLRKAARMTKDRQ
jgi:DNA polymerase